MEEERNVIAALRYFDIGESAQCAVCKGAPNVARMTTTLNSKVLVTVMCSGCSEKEIAGLFEREEMIPSADGTHLVSRMLAAATNDAIARIAGKMLHQSEPSVAKKKRKKSNKKKKKGKR